MKQNDFDTDQLREKIRIGLELTFKKLLQQKQAADGVFVWEQNGKITKVKARDVQL
jgi:hypothetical protein